jgi:hypothetical protein
VVGSSKLMAKGFQIEGIMALSRLMMRVVGYLRAGYPKGVPAHDYVPLLALLRRRLSDDELMAVATELTSDGSMTPVGGADMGVAITKRTDEMPSPEDTERVGQRLVAVGWPVTDTFNGSN